SERFIATAGIDQRHQPERRLIDAEYIKRVMILRGSRLPSQVWRRGHIVVGVDLNLRFRSGCPAEEIDGVPPAVEELRGAVAVHVADGVFSDQRSGLPFGARQRDDQVKTFGALVIGNLL